MTSASPLHEAALGRGPVLGLHAGVVGERAQARLAQRRGDLVGVAAGAAVDDRGSVGRVGEARLRAAPAGAPSSPCPPTARRRRRGWGGRSRSAPAAGRAVRSGRRSPPRPPRRRRRAGHHRRPTEPLGDLRQAQVVGPEVVPPLGDAVRLVDREQVDPPLAERFEEDAGGKALRRAVDDPRRAAAHLRERARAPPRRLIPEEIIATGWPAAVSRCHWSLHQRDQRADHDRQVLASPAPAAGSRGSCRRRSASRSTSRAPPAPPRPPPAARAASARSRARRAGGRPCHLSRASSPAGYARRWTRVCVKAGDFGSGSCFDPSHPGI